MACAVVPPDCSRNWVANIMTGIPTRIARRTALLAPLALTGCGLWDHWFGTVKKKLPGKREPILGGRHALEVDEGVPKVVLPPPVRNAAWPQAGGNPAHMMGHLAANEQLAEVWRSDIGEGGGYRRKILAQPVVAGGLVFAMDSDAVVSAFELSSGRRVWRTDSKTKDDDSTNVGGGLGVDQGTLYAVNGLGEIVAFDAAKGTERWRNTLGAPTRSAPTIVEGRIYVNTIEDRLLALAAVDGRRLWSHQAANATTAVLGQPAPAFAKGLVVAGFGSGELACLRADSGTVVWTDSLGGAIGQASLADFSSIRGRPVIDNGRVFAIGMGGLAVGLDLPTGRRLWERQVSGETSPWVAGPWVFIVSLDQELAALSAVDGRVAWIAPLPRWEDAEKRKDSISWFGPTLLSDRLVVTSTSSKSLAVSPYTGAIIGRQSLSAAAAPLEPVVAQGTLLMVTDDARLLALR